MGIRDYEYILVPNILEKFKCSMCGECCKSKWRIDIDKKSYLETKQNLEAQKENIEVYIQENENSSYVAKFSGGHCKFITEDKKCKIHKEFGWECLSDTCKMYPRHLKLTSRGMEVGFGFSCKSAAKLLLTNEKFKIKKIKKEDYFLMKPHSISFMIPENNLSHELESRYYEIEDMAIGILNLDGELGKKVQYLEKVLFKLNSSNIETYNFTKAIEEFKSCEIKKKTDEKVEDELVKLIIEKQKRSKSVGIYYINLLRNIKLSNDLEKDKDILGTDAFTLTKTELENLKKLWNKEDDIILQNYILCNIFNKEIYYNKEFFMMKIVMLTSLLKLRILLNKSYLKRDLTKDEMIYSIKAHDEELSHDGEFFSKVYKDSYEDKIDIRELTKKMIPMLY